VVGRSNDLENEANQEDEGGLVEQGQLATDALEVRHRVSLQRRVLKCVVESVGAEWLAHLHEDQLEVVGHHVRLLLEGA